MLQFYKNELFLDTKLLHQKEYDEVQRLTIELDKSFLKIALNYAFISRLKYKNLLLKNEVDFFVFDYENLPRFTKPISKKDLDFLLDHNLFPISTSGDEVELVVADPSDNTCIYKFIDQFSLFINKIHIAEDMDILKALHIAYGDNILEKAVFGLYKKDPKSSAIETFTSRQLFGLGGICLVFLVLLFLYPIPVIIGINVLLNLFFIIAIVFKFILTMVGSRSDVFQMVSSQDTDQILDEELPVYTLLLPVFKESEVIYKLALNLQNLDYPKEKLDIKLLIEADDPVTFDAIKNLKFPCILDPVIIPYAQPKTKPKACNYGLYFCKGKYITIYDAEDIPDSNQLKLVNALFQRLPDNYIVVQCALNYFNKSENLLTRMFTLEYSYWFDYMLPGLDVLKIPIPLGGTSNHFKFDKLMELGGWDPFNVTEDADLGIRAYAKGYKVSVLNSTTFEEANNQFYNWIRQRSRWIKGYMQTYLVHMRYPIQLVRTIGWSGFFGFQFFIGGTFFTFLMYPILLFFFLSFVLLGFDFNSLWVEELNAGLLNFSSLIFPDWVVVLSIFNFLVGNLLMIYVNMIAVFRRRSYRIILFALANPVYWLMHSYAAYKGLFQLISKPFYWEKTNHGLTKADKSQVE